MARVFKFLFSLVALIPLVIYAWWPEPEDLK